MNDKIKLFQIANKSIAENKEFMAFLLSKYMELEKVSEQDICSELNCSIEAYYKLTLCKAPDMHASDFVTKINDIVQYTGVSVFSLSKIIKRVSVVSSLSDNVTNSFLMAARDRIGKLNEDNNKNLGATS